MYFFQLRGFLLPCGYNFCSIIFSFIGALVILSCLFVLYPPHILSSLLIFYFMTFCWASHFCLQYWFTGGGLALSSVSECRVGEMFSNVLHNPSWLMMNLVGVPPGFSKIFSYHLVPKTAFTFLCVSKNIKLRSSLSGFCHHVETLIMLTWKSRFSNLKCLQTSKWYIGYTFWGYLLGYLFSRIIYFSFISG